MKTSDGKKVWQYIRNWEFEERFQTIYWYSTAGRSSVCRGINMKILWLTLDSLMPLDTAGRLGVYKRLEQLWDKNDIYLYYFYSVQEELDASKELEKRCHEVKGYKRESNKLKLILNLIKYPYTVVTRINMQMIADIRKCLQENQIDLINVDFPQMGYVLQNLEETQGIPIVLNQHNIEWQRFGEISKSNSISVLKKMIFKLESIRLKKFEENLYSRIQFSAFTFVTIEDRDYFKDWIKDNKAVLEVIPGGADYHPVDTRTSNTHKLIFVGVMSNELNPEGALWFVHNILPDIKSKVPDTEFYIVGKDPVKELMELDVEGVLVTGFVDNLEDYYRMASAVVIPVLHGGGVKLKLLEAIGYEQIVISTSVGARGTEFENGKHIMIADEASVFADCCVKVLLDRSSYERFSINAKEMFLEKYTWKGICCKYQKLLESITSGQVWNETINQ